MPTRHQSPMSKRHRLIYYTYLVPKVDKLSSRCTLHAPKSSRKTSWGRKNASAKTGPNHPSMRLPHRRRPTSWVPRRLLAYVSLLGKPSIGRQQIRSRRARWCHRDNLRNRAMRHNCACARSHSPLPSPAQVVDLATRITMAGGLCLTLEYQFSTTVHGTLMPNVAAAAVPECHALCCMRRQSPLQP